ncbi:MAG: ergothioneine biosynthesis protein EgtB [Xanthobacteraceae bacterium]|nr:ergothioneine biosynthesis protein EgtB [Xanthobacteraceae bacterium]
MPGTAAARARNLRASRAEAFREVRGETERRAAPLSDEDQVIQSMPDASPTKWHRAHTTWFFEQFLLMPHLAGYRVFDKQFAYLFNSYYVAAGPRHARPQRGLVTRPANSEVAAYRAHVDAAVVRLIEEADAAQIAEVLRILEIGLNHEQQHQELLLTDILHAFSLNPVAPTYDAKRIPPGAKKSASGFVAIPEGLHTIGFAAEGYCFDNEGPAHQVYVRPVRIARSLVTNAQWLDFIKDGGYATPSLWLSDGWAAVQAEGWEAPGYWRKVDGVSHTLTLAGLRPVDPAAPVCHVSYYEADAFARWMGKDLPTEQEWEVAANAGLIDDAFGIVWQWTRSAYSPYPGYRAASGALGEYNGKFMINQMVLRGSSHATPAGHSRASYRNFFYPPARWQFSGLRLVDYGS